MRFKQFLQESRTFKSASTEEAVDWILKNAPKYWEALTNNRAYAIFRGEDMNAEFVISHSGEGRKSRNTVNHTTLLVDNAKSWSQYPKRSESYICSTDYEYASDFGKPYYMIPMDSTKIGVCSDGDFWDSFPNLGNVSYMIRQIPRFNDGLTAMIQLGHALDGKTLTYDEAVKKVSTFSQLEHELNAAKDLIQQRFKTLEAPAKEIVKNGLKDVKLNWSSFGHTPTDFERCIFIVAAAKNEKMTDFIQDEMLNPSKNDLSLVHAHELHDEGVEVWFSGEALCIDEDHFDDLVAAVRNKNET